MVYLPFLQVDGLQSMQHKSNDAKVAEDGGKEDTFVDCPDEIETSESQTTSEERDEIQNTQLEEIQSSPSTQDEDLTAEMAVLRMKLDETVAEKQSFVQKYEVRLL